MGNNKFLWKRKKRGNLSVVHLLLVWMNVSLPVSFFSCLFLSLSLSLDTLNGIENLVASHLLFLHFLLSLDDHIESLSWRPWNACHSVSISILSLHLFMSFTWIEMLLSLNSISQSIEQEGQMKGGIPWNQIWITHHENHQSYESQRQSLYRTKSFLLQILEKNNLRATLSKMFLSEK